MASDSNKDEQKVAVASQAVSLGPSREAPPVPASAPRCVGRWVQAHSRGSSPQHWAHPGVGRTCCLPALRPWEGALWEGCLWVVGVGVAQRARMSHSRVLGMEPPTHRPTLERTARPVEFWPSRATTPGSGVGRARLLSCPVCVES